MIGGEDASRILIEVMKGRTEWYLDTPEQSAYRKEVKRQVDEIHAGGNVVDLPREWL